MLLRASENRLVQSIATRLVLVVVVLVVGSAPVKSTKAWQPITCRAPVVAPPQEDGWAALKLDEGILFVWNRPDIHFTLTVKGKEIKPLNDSDHIFFNVDGKVLQIQLASISDFAPDAKEKKLDDKSILAAHRNWETKFIEGLLHSKIRVQTFNPKLSNGSDASLWQFDMPEGMNAEAKKQLYLTIVRNNYVLLLNSAASDTVSAEGARRFLLDTIATLKISPTTIDVKKLSESIRKGAVP